MSVIESDITSYSAAACPSHHVVLQQPTSLPGACIRPDA